MTDRAETSIGAAERRPPELEGLQILIVEDEVLVAMVVEEMLTELGCVVTGVAGTVSQALADIEARPEIDAAILDVNLGGEKIFPVADILADRSVPFIFATGFGPADLAQRYPATPLLHKPYPPEALARLLMNVTANRLQ